jgi:hypothetical protein
MKMKRPVCILDLTVLYQVLPALLLIMLMASQSPILAFFADLNKWGFPCPLCYEQPCIGDHSPDAVTIGVSF